jgi:hypothetical protein
MKVMGSRFYSIEGKVNQMYCGSCEVIRVKDKMTDLAGWDSFVFINEPDITDKRERTYMLPLLYKYFKTLKEPVVITNHTLLTNKEQSAVVTTIQSLMYRKQI